MKIQIPRKIRTEDFESEDQAVAGKIGDMYNPNADEIYQVLNGRIDFDNLNRQKVDVLVQLDSAGALRALPSIKTTVAGRVSGLNLIRAVNIDNPGIFPTQAPWVSFTTNGNLLTISNVSGLQPNSQYRLTLELIV